MAFQYRVRSKEAWDKRANQTGGDFESWLKDEYRSYTPVKGENHIRILPPSPVWENADHYGMDIYVHYGVGPENASVICLFKSRGQPCPICEARSRAERARDEELARELKPAKRVLAFIINRKDEQQGVLAWAMPYTLDRDISKASRDRSTGEYYIIDHDEQGYDVYFDRDGEGLSTKYNGVSLSRRPSSVPTRHLEWLETHALPEVLNWRTYEEVKRLFEGAGRGEAPVVDSTPQQQASNGNDRRKPEDDESSSSDRRREPEPQQQPDRREPEHSDRPPQQTQAPSEERRPPIGRPGAAAANGADTPPFDTSAASPSGRSRAEELRARFSR